MQMRQNVDPGVIQWMVPVDKNAGLVTRSVSCAPPVVGHKTTIAREMPNKLDAGKFDNDSLEPLIPLASFAALALDNARLNQSILEGYMHTIKVLAATIDAKDPYTHGHSQRVSEYALIVAAKFLSLPPEELKIIEYA